MKRNVSWAVVCVLCVFSSCLLAQDAAKVQAGVEMAKKKFKPVESKACVLYTDLPKEQAAAMAGKMDLLGEEYAHRLTGLGGSFAAKKMSLVVFKNPDDYFALGVNKESGGVFTNIDMVLFDPENDFVWHAPKRGKKMHIWHVIQHETFHLFSSAMVNKSMPPWLDEGMAEYYGGMIFSGDAFFAGDVSGGDLKVVQMLLQGEKFKTWDQLFAMTHKDWETGDRNDYDQAWSIVQFLMHGEHGKYQKPFMAMLGDLARNKPVKAAMSARLGDLKAIQKQYEEYWSSLTEDSTSNVLAKALVAAATGATARAAMAGQKFKDFDEFIAAVKDKSLKDKSKRPLPAEALANVESQYESVGKWSLAYVSGKPQVTLEVGNGKYVGSAVTRPGEVVSVKVDAKKEDAGGKK